MSKTIYGFPLVLACVPLFSLAASDDVKPATRPAGVVDWNRQLGDLTNDVYRLTDSRAELVNSVRVGLLSPLDADRKAALCYLAGEARLVEVVPELAANIALEPTIYVENIPSAQRLARWWPHPAAEALLKIGVFAVPALVENLKGSDDRKVRELSAWIIRSVLHCALGEDNRHPDGRVLSHLVIERAAERERDPEKNRRLKEALKYFEE